MFEDSKVEKEVDIRKRVLKDYNKKEEDFFGLKEYNDYLEEIETIVFNLTNNIDIIGTNKRIEQYKKDNKEMILKNKTRAGREEIELEEILDMEKQEEEQRRAEIIRLEKEAKRRKLRDKEALIDELMFSQENAKNIINNFSQQTIQVAKEEIKPTLPTVKVCFMRTFVKFYKILILFYVNRRRNFLPVLNSQEAVAFCRRCRR